MSRPNTFEATRVANGDEPNDVLSHIKFRYVIHWYSIWLLLTYCTWLYCTSTTFDGKKFFCPPIFLWGCWMNEKGESFDVGSNQGKQGIWKRNVNLALFFQHHESSPQIVVFQNEDEPDDSIWCPDWLVVVHLHFQSRREKGRKQLGYMKRKMSKVMAKRKNEKRKRFNREERLPKMQTYFMCQTTEKGQNYRIVKHRKLFNPKRKRKRKIEIFQLVLLLRVHHPHYIVTFPNHSRFTTAPADSWPPQLYELKITRWARAVSRGIVHSGYW